MEFTFNTGRSYSPKGQIITFRVEEETKDSVNPYTQMKGTFTDHTRGITGAVEFLVYNDGPRSCAWIARKVMSCYDRGAYHSSADDLTCGAPLGISL